MVMGIAWDCWQPFVLTWFGCLGLLGVADATRLSRHPRIATYTQMLA
jgi:hypothetical protein